MLDGWKRYYSPDVVPGLWDKLSMLVGQGDLIATEEVYRELEKKDDEVFAWAKKNSTMFLPIDGRIQIEVRAILKDHSRLLDTRRNRSGADPFVIALARIEECSVVTAEGRTRKPDKPHIPDVCDSLGIRCINLLELCREQNWTFR